MDQRHPEQGQISNRRAGGRKNCDDAPIKPLRMGLKATDPPETMNVGAFTVQTVLHYITNVFFTTPAGGHLPTGRWTKKKRTR